MRPPMEEWLDKMCVPLPQGGVLFSLRKEGNPATCYRAAEPGVHMPHGISQSPRTGTTSPSLT